MQLPELIPGSFRIRGTHTGMLDEHVLAKQVDATNDIYQQIPWNLESFACLAGESGVRQMQLKVSGRCCIFI